MTLQAAHASFTSPYSENRSLCLSLTFLCFSPCILYFLLFTLIPVQNPCMEMAQINFSQIVVPVGQRSIESPSLETGQRRFIPKTIPVSTAALLSSCVVLSILTRLSYNGLKERLFLTSSVVFNRRSLA